MNKTDFDNKLTSFNEWITSNKTKHLEVQKTLNNLITKGFNFFLGRINFASNDGSQNTSVYRWTLDTLELKKDKGTDYFLVRNQKEYLILKLIHYILLSCIAGLDKFTICVDWFSYTSNRSARTFVHAKLCVHKTVTVGATLYCLIYNLLITIAFPCIFCYQLILKNISRRYAQHKGFSCFNWTSANGLKIDQSRKSAITYQRHT